MKMCCQYMGKSRAVAPWAHAVNCRTKKKKNKVTISLHPPEEKETITPQIRAELSAQNESRR